MRPPVISVDRHRLSEPAVPLVDIITPYREPVQ
jgi:hypothetical protein